MKKYYLYRQPIHSEKSNEGIWYFDDEFDSYEDAFKQAKINSLNGSWKTWQIQEVIVFNTNE